LGCSKACNAAFLCSSCSRHGDWLSFEINQYAVSKNFAFLCEAWEAKSWSRKISFSTGEKHNYTVFSV
jgi:hypothetical protein